MRLLPYGPDATLVEVDSTDAALRLHQALQGHPDVVESVPAARTVLVVGTVPELDRLAVAPAEASVADPVVLEVVYDGADLDSTAAELGMSADDLVERHSAATYTVGFCGFSPGFAYLTGLHPSLRVARHATPRTRVPAGSVGIAGEFTGVYPRSSPGGWRLLGRTDAVVWDVDRNPPALLTPGTPVRFRPR
jgi:KipI family sensor histidine kinase inhibitor